MLSHFKGHAMGSFGGALKNMSIGMASTNGKLNIHSAGRTLNQQEAWNNLPPQDDSLESMADACKGIISYFGKENIVYINVANNLSVDCDCDCDSNTTCITFRSNRPLDPILPPSPWSPVGPTIP